MTPAFLLGAYILFTHEKVDSYSKLEYNYPYFMYLTLAIWWVVCTLTFISPSHRYGDLQQNVQHVFAGETTAELVAMVIGYIIGFIIMYLANKELELNILGIFKTPTREMRAECKREIYATMMSKSVKEEVMQLAREEFEMQKQKETNAVISDEVIPKGVITHNPTLRELASD